MANAILLAGVLMFASASAAVAATPSKAAAPAKPVSTAKPSEPENIVAYDDLRQHVGQAIVVHTTFKTTRAGLLTKVSNMELTLRVDTAAGPTEMTIPRNTVRSVAVATPAAEPGKPSAKKN